MSADNYIFREACPDENPVILRHLMQYFILRAELPVRFLKKIEHEIDETEKNLIFEDAANRFSAMLAKCPSLVAVHKESGNIVGVSVMRVDENPRSRMTTAGNDEDSVDMLNPVPLKSKFYDYYITNVILQVERNVDFFEKFPKLRTILELELLCVEPAHCGRGLASRLIHETVKYAKRQDAELVYGVFISPHSIKAAEKNGFQSFSDLDIVSLRDSDGSVIYKDTEPYVISVMAKLL